MTESTLRPGVTMPIHMPYTPTGIQPIPRIMPPARPSLLSRLRTWRHRPSRAELTAGRAVAWARVAELEARVETMDRDRLLLDDELGRLQEIAAKWDQLVDTAEEFDEEHGDLNARHVALRTEHIALLVAAQSKDATIERLEGLFVEMAQQREAAREEAWTWQTAYNAAFGPLASDAPVDETDAKVVDLLAWREAAAAAPVEEFHTGMTGSWNRDDLRAIVENAGAPA